MGQIAEVICGPLLKMLEERIINNEMKRKSLLERKKELIAFIDQARVDKVHREKEQLKAKEVASMRSADETLIKKLEPEIVPSTSNPIKSTEMPGVEKAEKSSDKVIAEKTSDPHSPEKSDITSDESTYNSPEVATGDEVDMTEPKSTLISEQQETDTSNNNNDGDSVAEKKINVEN